MQPENPNLTGKLLLAHPNLRDPNFRRSIVYLAKHDAGTGAFGFILNRPTEQTFASIDTTGISPQWAEIPLYLGGPVGVENILLVTLEWDSFLRKMHIAFSTDPADAEPYRSIAVLGYAGWSAGQLESEMEQNSWAVLDPDDTAGQLLEADASTWKRLIGEVHPQLRLLAEMPDDPSLN